MVSYSFQTKLYNTSFAYHMRATFPAYLFLVNAVAQLVEALRCMPEGRWFDSRWCHCNFFH